MYATVASVTPPVGPYMLPTKTAATKLEGYTTKSNSSNSNNNNNNKNHPRRVYRRQAELGLCYSSCQFSSVNSSTQEEEEQAVSSSSAGASSSSHSSLVSNSVGGGIETTTIITSKQRRIIRSPRCITDDEHIFPTDHKPYRDYDSRWQRISDQAGCHRQDGSTLTISRNLSPSALRMGLTPNAAKRVKSLNLWLDHNKDTLPKWLDVIADILVNLQHLTLSDDTTHNIFPPDEDGEDYVTVSARMRRLYVLYRLPLLKSIDDEPISRLEQRLSKPDNNNDDDDDTEQHDEGENNPCKENSHHRNDRLLRNDSLLDVLDTSEEDDDEDDDDDDDSYGPPLAVTESIGIQTAIELGAEIKELAEKVVALDANGNSENYHDSDDDDDVFDKIDLDESVLDGPFNSRSSSGSGEAREDKNSNYFSSASSSCDRDIVEKNSIINLQTIQESAEVEIDVSDGIGSIGHQQTRHRPGMQLDENNLSEDNIGMLQGLEDQIIRDTATYELMSVATSAAHEWTAACGVLSFRSDRTCAPRIRMPFCGRRNNSRQPVADSASSRERAKKALREKQQQQHHHHNQQQHVRSNDEISACSPVQRQSSMKSPIVDGGDQNQKNGCKFFPSSSNPSSLALQQHQLQPTKFFPSGQKLPLEVQKLPVYLLSANQKMPPSKSLSSPFPLQFRERPALSSSPPPPVPPPPPPVPTPPPIQRVDNSSVAPSAAMPNPQMVSEFSQQARDAVLPPPPPPTSPLETITGPLSPAANILPSYHPYSPTKKPPESTKVLVRSPSNGDLPPPCPVGRRKKGQQIPASLAAIESRKARKLARKRLKASTENARCMSVFDLNDEDEDSSDDDEEEGEDHEEVDGEDDFVTNDGNEEE